MENLHYMMSTLYTRGWQKTKMNFSHFGSILHTNTHTQTDRETEDADECFSPVSVIGVSNELTATE